MANPVREDFFSLQIATVVHGIDAVLHADYEGELDGRKHLEETVCRTEHGIEKEVIRNVAEFGNQVLASLRIVLSSERER